MSQQPWLDDGDVRRIREHLLRILDHAGDILEHVEGLEVTRRHIHDEALAAIRIIRAAREAA